MKSKAPYYVELEGVKDLARLVCALERTPSPVFSLNLRGEDVLAAPIDLMDGRPVIYHAKFSTQAEFLAYRNVGGVEDIAAVDTITSPTFSYSPIIRVDKMPADSGAAKNSKKGKNNKNKDDDKNSGYSYIRLKDASSLAKVGTYRIFLEEAPLPLFLLKEDSKTVLGTFMSMNGADSVSY
ncbi:MAG: hypothetical protein ACE5JV_01335, partial [Nitrososphaerales archaeon]